MHIESMTLLVTRFYSDDEEQFHDASSRRPSANDADVESAIAALSTSGGSGGVTGAEPDWIKCGGCSCFGTGQTVILTIRDPAVLPLGACRRSAKRIGWHRGRADHADHKMHVLVNREEGPPPKRRDRLPKPHQSEKSVSLWSILKEVDAPTKGVSGLYAPWQFLYRCIASQTNYSLNSVCVQVVGKDLTKVCLPVYFNEPLSALQKMAEELEYSELIDKARQPLLRSAAAVRQPPPTCVAQGPLTLINLSSLKAQFAQLFQCLCKILASLILQALAHPPGSIMRLLYVAAFAVSGYAGTAGRTTKPFNPLLGETYEFACQEKVGADIASDLSYWHAWHLRAREVAVRVFHECRACAWWQRRWCTTPPSLRRMPRPANGRWMLMAMSAPSFGGAPSS